MLAEEAKACFSPWSTCWLHSSLEFEKSLLAEEAKACFSPWSTCWLHSSLEFEKSLKLISPL